jgi:glycine/D-amino acid oxidase-like deaminating enzyme
MTYDFLIIGGGIAGVSAAARLAPFGSVLLLEGESHLAHHASGRSAALYEPRYGAAPVVALSLASGEYFHGQPNLLTPRGLLILGRADQAAEFAHDIATMNLDAIPVDQARDMVPILNPLIVAYAAYADQAWDIDTDLMIQNFAREARSNGAQIVTGSPVTTIRRDRTWVVQTAAETYEARLLINAAGAWVDQIARMARVQPLGFQPMRRSMARIPAPGGHDVSRWPMIFGCGETWYAKPDAGALIVSPAEEHPMDPHDAFADDMVLAEGLARYEEMVTQPVTRLIANWAGLRTFAPDRVPVIGRDPAQSDFFWLAGQGGYGFQSSPAASQLAADLIAGRTTGFDTALIKSLDPARFSSRNP